MMNPLRWWSFVQDADRYEAEKASYAWEQAGRPDWRDGLALERTADGAIVEHAHGRIGREPVRPERKHAPWWRRMLRRS